MPKQDSERLAETVLRALELSLPTFDRLIEPEFEARLDAVLAPWTSRVNELRRFFKTYHLDLMSRVVDARGEGGDPTLMQEIDRRFEARVDEARQRLARALKRRDRMIRAGDGGASARDAELLLDAMVETEFSNLRGFQQSYGVFASIPSRPSATLQAEPCLAPAA